MADAEKRGWQEIGIIIIVLVVCLVPFSNKAFHIDDPLFLWTARQIQTHPLDFYGFTVNWGGVEQPMADVTKNPPLASYYIAAVASVAGWSETALHLAFLIVSIALATGVYFLARFFCRHALLATLIAIATPVFIVSSTTVMCDTLMLCFWVWGMVFWIRGSHSGRTIHFVGASILVALAALTKYYGMALIPLLFTYSVLRNHAIRWHNLTLLIPLLVLAAYQWLTGIVYGHGLLADAVRYATNVETNGGTDAMRRLVTGCAFTGGCLFPMFFFAITTWNRRAWIGAVVSAALLTMTIPLLGTISGFSISEQTQVRWDVAVQLALFAVVGCSILVVALHDAVRDRDADSVVLLLWVIGTFIFAGWINWTTNGRSLLPIVPAVAILITRQMYVSDRIDKPQISRKKALLFIPAVALTMATAYADYRLADSSRTAAHDLSSAYQTRSGTVWFEGHWGFQYYIQSLGAKPIDFKRSQLSAGDIVIVPRNNTALTAFPEEMIRPMRIFSYHVAPRLATMEHTLGAGFYSSIWGPLPFAVGNIPLEEFYVFLIERPISLK